MTAHVDRAHDRAVRRPSHGARRAGYVIAIILNLVLLYLVNVQPGWHAVPFLTADMSLVLPTLNLSLVAGAVANLTFLVSDRAWWKSLGDLLTTGISLAVLARLWQVFPFAFSGSFDWSLPARVLLVVALLGTGVAVVVHLLSLLRALAGGGRAGGPGGGGTNAPVRRPPPDVGWWCDRQRRRQRRTRRPT